MPRPVCALCEREMTLEKVGAVVAFMAKAVTTGRPYQLWHGDEYKCPSCHARVVVNYGAGPAWEHFHTGAVPVYDVKSFERPSLAKVTADASK